MMAVQLGKAANSIFPVGASAATSKSHRRTPPVNDFWLGKNLIFLNHSPKRNVKSETSLHIALENFFKAMTKYN
jgi:hypothetical protein